jgi:hypothetical protein
VGEQGWEDARSHYSPATVARRTLEFHREIIERAGPAAPNRF